MPSTINALLSHNISSENAPVLNISLISQRPDKKIAAAKQTSNKKRMKKAKGQRSRHIKHSHNIRKQQRTFDTEKLLRSVRRSHAKQLQSKKYLSFSHQSVNPSKEPRNQNFYNPLRLGKGNNRNNGTTVASQRTGDGRALITLKRKSGRKTCFVVARPDPFNELNDNPWMMSSQCK